jgi:hypothetical protein
VYAAIGLSVPASDQSVERKRKQTVGDTLATMEEIRYTRELRHPIFVVFRLFEVSQGPVFLSKAAKRTKSITPS